MTTKKSYNNIEEQNKQPQEGKMEPVTIKPIEDGILGFEDVKEWELKAHSNNHIELIGIGVNAKFNLVKSTAFKEFEGDHYIAEDAYYVICFWADTPTIDTSSPFIVNEHGVYQMLTGKGQMRQPLTFEVFNRIISE
jgi:hypothetical protein